MSTPYAEELIRNARYIASTGKGILAADESTGTIGTRFDSIQVENTEESRRAYRQLLFKTDGLEQYISGVIMFDETFYQKTDEGIPFVELLKSKGILTGIKVTRLPTKTFYILLIFIILLFRLIKESNH